MVGFFWLDYQRATSQKLNHTKRSLVRWVPKGTFSTDSLNLRKGIAKETFTASKSPSKIFSAFFALCSILLLLKYYVGWIVYSFAFICIVLAFLLWKVPPPIIEVDEHGIRRIQHGNSLTSSMSRILLPDIGCEWVWVRSISTTRLNSGSFITSISVSDDMPNKPKYRVTVESSIYENYVAILKAIKDKAMKAHFDEMTESTLKRDVGIRPVRPYINPATEYGTARVNERRDYSSQLHQKLKEKSEKLNKSCLKSG